VPEPAREDDAVDQVRTGERLIGGRYRLQQEIGRGGMGIVWLAEDRTIGRRVAIKELHLPDGIDAAERTVLEERVLREARAAGRLNDPGVVTVYDVVQENGATFIVMELIQAPTLHQLVERRGPLPPPAVARIAEQLLSALGAAHAAGIVHRDVKPSNIMVLPNGRVKLTDFGIAQSTEDTHLTTSGILVGSPVYMAPERLRGHDADAGSDLWSLGAVLFFAVEGYDAYDRSSTAAIMHAILNEVPYLTRCQGPLAAVITGLLNTHPTARPTAAQVGGLLGQATYTPPAGFATPVATTPTPHRPRRRVPTSLVALVAVALLAGGYLLRVATEPKPTGPADRDPTLTYGEGGYLAQFEWDTSSPAGGCVNSELDQGRRVTTSAQVECTDPHGLQVFEYRTFWSKPDEYGDGDLDLAYPGEAGLTGYAENVCGMIFGSNKVPDTGDLRYRALVPTRRHWDDGGRDVVCVLYQEHGTQLDKSYVVG
jgi:eukaryotic-like serine/threonine-protein kinase